MTFTYLKWFKTNDFETGSKSVPNKNSRSHGSREESTLT